MKNEFPDYIKSFFQEYLIITRNLSKNTISTYRYSFINLFHFFAEEKNIKILDIKLEMFTNELIDEYINWMQARQLSTKTINNRITVLKVFFRYIARREFSYLSLSNSIDKLKLLKETEKIIEYLSIEEISILFNIPDYKNPTELKELAILTLLYESAMRVQELCNLKVKDISLSENKLVVVNGKGNKSRIIPIASNVIEILTLYINTNELSEEDYLFSSQRNAYYSRHGISKIIKKYVNKAREQNDKYFKINVTPHTFRHSKAMHLLDSGVALTTIEKMLGHSSIKTTEIYAKASSQKLREAIETNSKSIKITSKYRKKEKEDLINWLKKL